ncbi:hypothetical protein EDB86DRAFT_2946438, partial [Lactarius hatsudake]
MLELLNYSTYSNHHTPSHPLDTANIATSPVPSCTPFPQSGNEEASGRKHFEAVYTIFLGDLLDNFRKHNMPEKVIECYLRSSFHAFFPPDRRSYHPTEHEIQRARQI